jgi:hypothetical protein
MNTVASGQPSFESCCIFMLLASLRHAACCVLLLVCAPQWEPPEVIHTLPLLSAVPDCGALRCLIAGHEGLKLCVANGDLPSRSQSS